MKPLKSFKGFQTKNRVYIIPTRFGLTLSFIIIILLLTTAALGVPKGNILVIILVTITIMAMFMTHSNLEGITISVPNDCYSQEDQNCEVKLIVYNSSSTPKFSISISGDPRNLDSKKDFIGLLKEHSTKGSLLEYFEQNCGLYPINKIKISTVYPLGLFYAWKWIEVDHEMIFYPKPEGDPFIGTSGREKGNHHGALPDQQDFSGFRTFRKGDSQKHINWKALAKGHPLMVKEFNDGSGGQFLFRWEDTNHIYEKNRAAQLSLWIHNAHRHGDDYGIILPNYKSNVAGGEAHFYKSLKELTRLAQDF